MKKSIEESNKFTQLTKLLREVYASNPFYKKKFTVAGIRRINDITAWKDFKKLPFTTKSELLENQRKHPPFGTNLTYPLEQCSCVQFTSGTTQRGILRTVYSAEDMQKKINDQALFFQKIIRIHPKDRVLCMLSYGAYIFATASWQKTGALVYPPTNIEKEELILQDLIQNKITLFQSTSSVILRLTRFAINNHIDLKKVAAVRLILAGGEVGPSVPSIKHLIETNWGAKCLDFIGSSETGRVGGECENFRSVHLNEKETVFEIIDPATGLESREGELVITPLWRYAFPLIRYRTGDYVKLGEKPCKCGYHSRTVENGILGRIGSNIRIGKFYGFPWVLEDVLRKNIGTKEFTVILRRYKTTDEMIITVETSLFEAKTIVRNLHRDIRSLTGLSPKINIIPIRTQADQSWKRKWLIDIREKQINAPKNLHTPHFSALSFTAKWYFRIIYLFYSCYLNFILPKQS